MLQLAKTNAKRRFLFVASKLNKGLNSLPSNVELKRDVSPQEFGKLMEGASIVVVPLKEDVGSSGQMLCIQSMRYHKPIVYTDVSSINYYFTETSGIPYEIGSLDSLLIIALKQYRLYHSNDTASLAWLQVSLFTWLAIPV